MDTSMISPQKRHEIIDALRHGTVPGSSLDAFAVGLGDFRKRASYVRVGMLR